MDFILVEIMGKIFLYSYVDNKGFLVFDLKQRNDRESCLNHLIDGIKPIRSDFKKDPDVF